MSEPRIRHDQEKQSRIEELGGESNWFSRISINSVDDRSSRDQNVGREFNLQSFNEIFLEGRLQIDNQLNSTLDSNMSEKPQILTKILSTLQRIQRTFEANEQRLKRIQRTLEANEQRSSKRESLLVEKMQGIESCLEKLTTAIENFRSSTNEPLSKPLKPKVQQLKNSMRLHSESRGRYFKSQNWTKTEKALAQKIYIAPKNQSEWKGPFVLPSGRAAQSQRKETKQALEKKDPLRNANKAQFGRKSRNFFKEIHINKP